MTSGLTFALDFTGEHISVYGSINAGALGGATFAVDGASPDTFTQPDMNPGEALYNHQLFVSPELTSGSHQILVTGNAGFIFDYILVGTPVLKSLSTAIPPHSSASSSVSSGLGSSNKHTPVGAIAGGIVGGIMFLAALLGLLLFRRRRSQRQFHDTSHKELIDPPFLPPHTLPHTEMTPSEYTPSLVPTPHLATPSPPRASNPTLMTDTQQVTLQPTLPPPLPYNTVNTPESVAELKRRQQEVVLSYHEPEHSSQSSEQPPAQTPAHVDSGERFGGTSYSPTAVVELPPPIYTPF